MVIIGVQLRAPEFFNPKFFLRLGVYVEGGIPIQLHLSHPTSTLTGSD